MRAKELRIGNKLQKNNGEIFTILRLDNTQDVLVEEQRGLLTLGYNLIGIPLTERILLKCGFKKFNEREEIIYSHVHREDFIDLLILNEKIIAKDKKDSFYYFLDIDTCQEDDYFKAISAPMQNLHTLQNYYPAFSGTELQINL